ncbi:hypothetical protein LguiB_002319 [Lonicera macranthoides]
MILEVLMNSQRVNPLLKRYRYIYILFSFNKRKVIHLHLQKKKFQKFVHKGKGFK